MQADLFNPANPQAATPHPDRTAGDVSGTSYFNTVSYSGDELAARKAKAQVQEAAILALYRVHGTLGPWQVWELLDRKHPITSVRRAITNLAGRDLLAKTDSYRDGPEGAREHLWSAA